MTIIIFAVAVIIWWKDKRCQTETYQCEARYATELRLSNAPPNQRVAEEETIASDCEPKGFFCRLLGPANLPSVVLVIIGLLGVWIGLETIDGVQQELVLTHRPRISVRDFHFSEVKGTGAALHVPTGIQNGSLCMGQFTFGNQGGTRASIEEIDCLVWAESEDGTLPARPPYIGRKGIRPKILLDPGDSSPWLFKRQTPLLESMPIGSGQKGLYVLGWIRYRDDAGFHRTTRFCRKWDHSTERFRIFKDPDYESSY